jgi:dTDP-4-amino-4,6-dideoxygalactose transaminase
MNILGLKKNCFFVGRAATAIFLILKSENMENKKILYPANICYATIYPALYAGCSPVFCDVSKEDGNVTFKEICAYIDQVSAIVIPHMYGNPVRDIEKIRTLCEEKGVLFIEDCASAMGAILPEGICGSFGDYSIFSTGYSKTIDIGNGGFLLTDRSICKMQSIYEQLPVWNQQIEENESFFSKLYRLIRNNWNQNLDQYIWEGLKYNLKDVFLYQYPQIDIKIQTAISGLEKTVDQRRREKELYQALIHETKDIKIYKFHDGAVPWRFNLFVSQDKKHKIIDILLKQKVPVSDWYPDVTPIFGNHRFYKNAKTMEKQIINFPLLIEDVEIQRICDCINQFANREKR